ncbi:MAG: hypothetical protein K0Q66_494, partial [Chitinophagaceae bacterium]|nr:hypothetical protein [Chitinophagaceae bacterium]
MRNILSFLLLLFSTASFAQQADLKDCGRSPDRPDCNYINNNEFIERPGAPFTDAFVPGDVPGWWASHGSPDLNSSLISSPPPANNFATMYAGNHLSHGRYYNEGIATKIYPVRAGKEYLFSLFRTVNSINDVGLPVSNDIT